MAITLESVLDKVLPRNIATQLLKVAHQCNLLHDRGSIDRIVQDYVDSSKIEEAGNVLLRRVSLESAVEFYEQHRRPELALEMLPLSYTKHFTVMDHMAGALVTAAWFGFIPFIIGGVGGSFVGGCVGCMDGCDPRGVSIEQGGQMGFLYGGLLPGVIAGAFGFFTYFFSEQKEKYYGVSTDRDKGTSGWRKMILQHEGQRKAVILQSQGYIDEAVAALYSQDEKIELYRNSGWVFHAVSSAIKSETDNLIPAKSPSNPDWWDLNLGGKAPHGNPKRKERSRLRDGQSSVDAYAHRTLDDVVAESQFSIECVDRMNQLWADHLGLTFFKSAYAVEELTDYLKLARTVLMQQRMYGERGVEIYQREKDKGRIPEGSQYFGLLKAMRNVIDSLFVKKATCPEYAARLQWEVECLEKRILIDERVRWLRRVDEEKRTAVYEHMLEAVDIFDAVRIAHYMGDARKRNDLYKKARKKVSQCSNPIAGELKSNPKATFARLAEELGDVQTAIDAYEQAVMPVDAAFLILKHYKVGVSSFDEIRRAISLLERAERHADAGYVAREHGLMEQALMSFRKARWTVDETLTVERAREIRDTENAIQYTRKMNDAKLVGGCIQLASDAGDLERALILAEELKEYKTAANLCQETDPTRAIGYLENLKLWEDAARLIPAAGLEESDPLRALAIYKSAKWYSQAYDLAVKERYTDEILSLANAKILQCIERGEEWRAFFEIDHTRGLDLNATLEAAYRKIVGRRGTVAAAVIAYLQRDYQRAVSIADGQYGGDVDLCAFDEIINFAARALNNCHQNFRAHNQDVLDYFKKERKRKVDELSTCDTCGLTYDYLVYGECQGCYSTRINND
jgi:tetratricopeptide (TPR) repeat protein